MRRKAVGLVLAAAMIMTASGTVYAAEKSENSVQNSETTEAGSEENSDGITECEAGAHQWSEWNITIPADCVTNGQKMRKCEVCGITETASIARTNEHDLKEVSRQDATADKPGFILYTCKRNGCDYQEKKELPVKETQDTEHLEDNKNSEAKDEDTTKEEKISSKTDEDTGKGLDAKEMPEDTDIEKNGEQEFPDEDIDEGSASFAYATSSEVVAEYDPTTAVSTRKIARDPANPESEEDVEGMTVQEGIVKVQRDSEGNITDLAVSSSLGEIKNGFSFSSESKMLHSISIINEKDSSENWITLTARKTASELGIRIKQTADGMAVTLTENEKSVQIVKVEDNEKNITLTTSTDGTCVISRHIQKFELSQKGRNLKDINEILFCDMSSQKPSVKLASVKEFGSDKDKKVKPEEEKLYWIQQYDDESQTPIVITIYG